MNIMKKFILSVAVLVASITFAPTANAQTQDSQAEMAQEQESTYKEIQISDVPAAVTDALKKAYPTAIIHKAGIGEAKDFQLEVEVEGQRGLLFADANGNWIQK